MGNFEYAVKYKGRIIKRFSTKAKADAFIKGRLKGITVYRVRTYLKVKQHARNSIMYSKGSAKRLKRKVIAVKYVGKKQGFHIWDVAFKRSPRKKRKRVGFLGPLIHF